jgi:hypothetical protein
MSFLYLYLLFEIVLGTLAAGMEAYVEASR